MSLNSAMNRLLYYTQSVVSTWQRSVVGIFIECIIIIHFYFTFTHFHHILNISMDDGASRATVCVYESLEFIAIYFLCIPPKIDFQLFRRVNYQRSYQRKQIRWVTLTCCCKIFKSIIPIGVGRRLKLFALASNFHTESPDRSR